MKTAGRVKIKSEKELLLEDNLRLQFSKNIKFLRERKGYTQDVLAKMLGRSTGTICSYENGDIIPTLSIAMEISNIFKCPIDILIKYDLEKEYIADNYGFYSFDDDSFLSFESQMYKKFAGMCYWIYFLNTNHKYEQAISFGKLQIIPDFSKKRHIINMFIYKDNSINGEIVTGKEYKGNLVLFSNHIYIYLRGNGHFERGVISLYNPMSKNNNPYIGGLGISLSLSAGLDKDPCTQRILLSNKEINLEAHYEKLLSMLKISNLENEIIRITKENDKEAYCFIKSIT